MFRVLAILIASVAAACGGPSSYQCAAATDCGAGGACEADGRCSVADSRCPSGRRYGDSAGALAGTCVPADQPDGPVEIDGPIDAAAGGDAHEPEYRLCVPGIELSGDDPCALAVCATQPWCCQVSWDEQCVLAAEARCDLACSRVLAAAGHGEARAGSLDGATFTSRFVTSFDGTFFDVAWGDLDTDGNPDLAIARQDYGGVPGVVILRGGPLSGGNLTLTPVPIAGAAAIGTMLMIEWRDFDNDDDLDALASGDDGVFLIEAAPGGFVAHELASEHARAIWADDDGAAPWDLVVARETTQRLVHHQLTGPPYALDAVTAGNTLSDVGFVDLAWCDVTNDGRRDLIAARYGPAVKFTATTTGFGAAEPLSQAGPVLACGDLDDDLDNDLVIGDVAGPVKVVANQGGIGGSATYATIATFDAAGLELGDLDGNGRLDIVVSDRSTESAPLTVLDNLGSPGAGWFTPVIGPDWNGSFTSGRLDLGPLPR